MDPASKRSFKNRSKRRFIKIWLIKSFFFGILLSSIKGLKQNISEIFYEKQKLVSSENQASLNKYSHTHLFAKWQIATCLLQLFQTSSPFQLPNISDFI